MMKTLVAALFLCCALAVAQSPSAIAIHNAKIVTVSGAVIPKGTVVVRNGLIEAVGENVQVPSDAMLVEGEGLTVYPGPGAIIDLISGEKPGEMVGTSPVGQYISLGAGGRGGGQGRGFPSSLMGYIAYVRQIYLDAEHYTLVKDAYAKNPVGMARPE